MSNLLKNPFFVYPTSFIFVFVLYALNWSDLLPKLSFSTILFFSSSFVLYFFIGYIISKKGYLGYGNIENTNSLNKHILVLLIGYTIDFTLAGQIPFFNLISGHSSSYDEFGVKTFHVLIATYNSYLTVYLFHCFLSNKRFVVFIYFILSIIPAILIVNRGMIIIALLSSFFVFVQYNKLRLNLRQWISISLVAALALYIFGHFGNIRSGNGDPNYIPLQSKATMSFMNSFIPKEYYWTYLYGASPLGNFQNNINNIRNVKYNFFDFVLFEMTPNFISKRIAPIVDRHQREPYLLVDWLTVGTMFSKSYGYMKWIGPIILILYQVVFLLIIIALVPKSSKYHVSTIAILCTLIFLNTFDNMLVFAGMILQLIFPIVFAMFEGKKFKIAHDTK